MEKIKRVSRKFILPLVLLACMALSSCKTSEWRAPDYGVHPNWESDFGYESPRVMSGAEGEFL